MPDMRPRPSHCPFCLAVPFRADNKRGWTPLSRDLQAWGKAVVGAAGKAKIGQASKRARQRERVFARNGGRCLACGTAERLTIDHIVPRSKGGTSAMANLQTLCSLCNSEKADAMPPVCTDT
jgi:5-methylcytosine-specific restriction endonuclease McrA